MIDKNKKIPNQQLKIVSQWNFLNFLKFLNQKINKTSKRVRQS